MSTKYTLPSSPPVPVDKHYAIFKTAEEKIMEKLGEFEYEEFLIGLRVAYDVLNSTNEPDVLPYTIESGYLGPVDNASKCNQISAEDGDKLWPATNSSTGPVHPLPREFMENIYAEINTALAEEAGTDLKTGVFAVLYGSPIKCYSISCTCPNRKKYCCYNPRTKVCNCYCSTRGC